MKKSILCIAIAMLSLAYEGKAQCDLAFNNLVVQPVSTTTVSGKCNVVMNVSFDITTNSGFKYLFFHSWLTADYPNPPVFNCNQSNATDPGTSAQLGTAVDQAGKSFLDIGFLNLNLVFPTMGLNNPTNVTSYLASTYLHDPTVVLTKVSNSPGLNVVVTQTATGVFHFTVTNLLVILNTACNSSFGVKTDIWGSNSNANDPKAQCYVCASAAFFNDPTVTGFKTCNVPARTYNLGIQTLDPVAKNITYKIYVDMDNDGALNTSTDVLAYTSGTISISASTPYSAVGQSLPAPYSNTQPYSEKNYLVLVEGPTLLNSIVGKLVSSGCIGLPVSLKTFSATRQVSNVMLRWETSFEQNNSGFMIERNIGGTWEDLAFVPSQAAGGNSTSDIVYNYVDRNNIKGITQYRLRQVDLDNKYTYSEIRAVRGDGQIGKITIYPNPSGDGKINILFDDANVIRNVSVLDMSGRMVKEYRSISNNNLTIVNLQPGMYTVKIAVPETGEQVVQKIVVNKR